MRIIIALVVLLLSLSVHAESVEYQDSKTKFSFEFKNSHVYFRQNLFEKSWKVLPCALQVYENYFHKIKETAKREVRRMPAGGSGAVIIKQNGKTEFYPKKSRIAFQLSRLPGTLGYLKAEEAVACEK